MSLKPLDPLDRLESQSIYILREVAAQFSNPVLLFSGGKDSIVLSRLSEKAFRPAPFPYSLLMIDTGHNFPETLSYIDSRLKELKETLIVRKVQDSIDQKRVTEELGPYASRNRLQSVTLLDAIRELKFDAIVGGARRDEEKSRAKERVFSVRNATGQWDPTNQRPELWSILNGRVGPGDQMRVFPLSDWTELDIWQYIEREKLEVPKIYFSHARKVVDQSGMLLAHSSFISPPPEHPVSEKFVRFRTVGDMTCTGAVVSQASSVSEVISEIKSTRITERGTRLDDKFSDSAMEDRKREGYF